MWIKKDGVGLDILVQGWSELFFYFGVRDSCSSLENRLHCGSCAEVKWRSDEGSPRAREKRRCRARLNWSFKAKKGKVFFSARF